jgi:hypothetical protein
VNRKDYIMARKHVTAYRAHLKEARALHDARYEIDNPKPRPSGAGAETGLERAMGYLWIVWLILAIAGAIISLPHTLSTVLATVGGDDGLQGALAIGYAVAVFIGVELALISVALVAETKAAEAGHIPTKAFSLAGLVNRLAVLIGFPPPLKLHHIPERGPATGVGLLALLFAASLTFNLVDAVFTHDAPAAVAQYQEAVVIISRLMAGALGPVLLLLAGHRFAQEAYRAATRRQRAEAQYQQALDAWKEERDASWGASAEDWLAQVAGMEGGAAAPVRPTLAAAGEALPPFSTNGHGVPAPVVVG